MSVPRTGVAALLVGGLLGLGAALSGAFVGALTCTSETSSCGPGGPAIRWQGRLFDSAGRLAAHVPVTVDFATASARPDVIVRTDRLGRFCFRWPRELVPAYVQVGDVTAAGRADPRFVSGIALDPAAHDPRIESGRAPPVSARAVVLTPNRYLVSDTTVFVNYRDWRADVDARKACAATAAPPWYQEEGALGNWRSVLVIALGLCAFGAGGIGLIFRRHGTGRFLAPVALASGIASIVALVVVWGPHWG